MDNRLLRSLRIKCHALSTYAPPSATTTYSKSCPPLLSPPLAVLSPPSTTLHRVHIHKSSLRNLELSRRVYAVRDAYKQIILSAEFNRTASPPSAVPSLSSLCSTLVGQNMPSELQKPVDYLQALSDPTADLYHHIPLQYRGWTLLSHALSIILEVCPHTSTLLIILFDLVLLHKLLLQAQQLLPVLLIYAISPSNSSASPPICHPAHATFLQDLLDQWLSAGFSDTVFLHSLSVALQDAPNLDVWHCKSLSKLVKSVSRTNLSWVLHLLCNLTNTIAAHVESTVLNPSIIDTLLAKLSAWMRLCCDRYISYSPAEFSACIRCEVYQLLLQGGSLGFPQWEIASQSSVNLQDIPDSFVSIATSWLSFSNDLLHKSQATIVANKLKKVKPRPFTYKDLVRCLYSNQTIGDCCSSFQSFASSLRSHGLLELEASLFACALHYVDEPKYEALLTTNNQPDQVKMLKRKLLNWVEDAEKRCFGPSDILVSQCIPNVNGLPRRSLPNLGAGSGWIWESSIGCWIRSSPAKPSKSDGGCHRTKRRHRHDPQRRSLHDIKSHKINCLEGEKTTFKSLLANALSNRVSLHSFSVEDSDDPQNLVACIVGNGYEDKCAAEAHAQSDDLLDLFAYNTSSPVKSLGFGFGFGFKLQGLSLSTSVLMSGEQRGAKPLPLSDILRDLAVLRASGCNLASLLPSAEDSSTSPILEATVAESLEFIKSSRAVLRIRDADAVGKQGNRVDELRNTLGNLVTVLKDSER
ncbi:hypothetical protein BDQ17DRAFT_1422654 [Cyathus striatus]|nr:hypothetical protein BDQ17DRAFT_1422654 [Cyathus striatus]